MLLISGNAKTLGRRGVRAVHSQDARVQDLWKDIVVSDNREEGLIVHFSQDDHGGPVPAGSFGCLKDA
jgi:hypothetical protein